VLALWEGYITSVNSCPTQLHHLGTSSTFLYINKQFRSDFRKYQVKAYCAKKMETLVLSPLERSLYMPDERSSSETSESEVTVGDMSTRRSGLNNFLVVLGIDAIAQTKKRFGEL
jgi:hypothetical protein